MASSKAPGCHRGSLETTEKALPYLGPSDGLNGMRFELLDTSPDLGIPRCVSVWIYVLIEAFYERSGEGGPIGFTESQCMLEQLFRCLAHGPSIPLNSRV